jgi:hypothetical protein
MGIVPMAMLNPRGALHQLGVQCDRGVEDPRHWAIFLGRRLHLQEETANPMRGRVAWQSQEDPALALLDEDRGLAREG